jgi:uncharacterized protein YacL
MSFEEDVKKLDLKSVTVGSIIAAFGLLVALSWKDLIQSVLNTFLPPNNNLFYQLVATVVLTLVSVFFGYLLFKFSQKSITDPFRRGGYRYRRLMDKIKVKAI